MQQDCQQQSHTLSSAVRSSALPVTKEEEEEDEAEAEAEERSVQGSQEDASMLSKSETHNIKKVLYHNEMMTYRPLGSTSLNVSIISLGGGAIGGLFGDIKNYPIDEILKEAFKNGINYIDTGYWYGQSRSEEILGAALKKFPRSTYIISTKIGRFELDFSRSYDYRADALLEQLSMSLKRLKLAYVDICYLQLRDSDFNILAHTIFTESLEALRIAKVTGKTKYIGIAGYTLQNIVNVLENSPIKIDIVMTYGRATLCDNSFGEYRQYFESYGVGVVNGAPLSMGLLSDEGPKEWHPAPSVVLKKTSEASSYCKSKGISLAKLAIEYATHFPGINTCLVGVSNKGQILQCIQIACSDGLTSNEERVRSRILRRYFDKLNNANWEGIDLHQYWKRMESTDWNKTFKKHSRLQLAKQQCICTMYT
ncbi:unnamed protein product [Thelazia callipaeda]|uniref:Aldo_ket_red domain-containing protein n=1 Tax=Thelazia callipaeda TaxID=103827 RepID=A0A0N5D3Y7_THECL|nr:unnamed protein product [Thelazia callipaeda]